MFSAADAMFVIDAFATRLLITLKGAVAAAVTDDVDESELAPLRFAVATAVMFVAAVSELSWDRVDVARAIIVVNADSVLALLNGILERISSTPVAVNAAELVRLTVACVMSVTVVVSVEICRSAELAWIVTLPSTVCVAAAIRLANPSTVRDAGAVREDVEESATCALIMLAGAAVKVLVLIKDADAICVTVALARSSEAASRPAPPLGAVRPAAVNSDS